MCAAHKALIVTRLDHEILRQLSQRHGASKTFWSQYCDKVSVIINRRTGEIQDAHLFVAVMGGSSLSFALATCTERLPEWIEGHVQAFAVFGGIPALIVPDNPKVAVIKACFYDPQITPP